LYKRRTSVTRRPTPQVQWSGWCQHGGYWRTTEPVESGADGLGSERAWVGRSFQ
jgi:hypothetical protein